MTAIDATGLQALEELADAVHESGRGLILCGAREQPARLMHQSEFEEHVGAGNISPSISGRSRTSQGSAIRRLSSGIFKRWAKASSRPDF